MHQTRKGQQWYFGMKLHIGVDSKTKLIHSMTTTAANVHDAKVLGELLHGNETRVYGDQAYRGQKAAIRRTRRTPRTSPTSAIVTAVWSMRWSAARTGRSLGSAPRSSIHSA